MAELTQHHRDKLSPKQFGLPGERKYPMPDKEHAALAKSFATKQEEAGNLSPAEKAQIDRKADKVLNG